MSFPSRIWCGAGMTVTNSQICSVSNICRMLVVPQDSIDIANIVNALKQGKTLVYPTETVYGLGCDATNQMAVDRVFQIKQRQREKAVLVLMADIVMARRYAEWSPLLERMAGRYWPGPLTVVARVKSGTDLAKGTIEKDGTIAFRVTSHPIAHEITAALGTPLVSTSANIATMKSPYDIKEVTHMFETEPLQPDMIIDAGALLDDSPSTIVSVVGREPTVLRQGDIVIE